MDGAIADFFQDGTRKILKAIALKDAEVRKLGLERALAKINDPHLAEQFVAAMEAELDGAVRKLLTPSSSATSSPGS